MAKPSAGNGARDERLLDEIEMVLNGGPAIVAPVLGLSGTGKTELLQDIAERAACYEGLRRVTESQDWENWILFMLRAIESTAQQTHDQVQRIRALMESVRARVQTEAPAIYSKDLIEVIFRHPYTKIQFVVDAGIAKRQTASIYLQTLAGLGILREQKHGREKYYINEALFNELAS